MNFKKLYCDGDPGVKERYSLVSGRILELIEETTVPEPYRDYFIRIGTFLKELMGLMEEMAHGGWEDRSLFDWQAVNRSLYRDILPEHYGKSYGNPAYAVKRLGKEIGQLLSCFYAELRGGIAYVAEGRLLEFTAGLETFVELYNLFESCETEETLKEEVKEALYYFFSDYCDVTMKSRVE